MKKYMICLTVPHAKAAHAQQSAQGEGSCLRTAISDALQKVLARPHIKGRVIRYGTISFSLIEEPQKARGSK